MELLLDAYVGYFDRPAIGRRYVDFIYSLMVFLS